MTFDKLEALAQGRVYTGRTAKKLGLVDELGTLEDAIAAAKTSAGLEGRRRRRPARAAGAQVVLRAAFRRPFGLDRRRFDAFRTACGCCNNRRCFARCFRRKS